MMDDDIRIEVLPPVNFGHVRFRVSDKYGRKTEFGCAPELTIGAAINLCTRQHYQQIARKEADRWAYPLDKLRG